MQYTTLLFNKDNENGVAKITLNRPGVGNCINLDMAKELMQAVISCSESPNIRAVLITGSGGIFSYGGDIKEMIAAGKNLAYYFKEMTAYLHCAISHLTRINAPVVIAVNGMAAGAGVSLVCVGDIVIAAESACFLTAYTRIGLTPDGGLTYFLPRIIGFRRAWDLILTNRKLSASEALNLGLVTQIATDTDLPAQAEKIAIQFALGATKALSMSKRLLHNGWTETLETQLELESQAVTAMGCTADIREGITAFLEKRVPKFSGV